MKSIAIDFKNKYVCIMTNTQQETEIVLNLPDKKEFISFFPLKEIMNDFTSFTWNFEDNLFSVNKEYFISNNSDEIITSDSFIPERIISYPGLSERYNDMLVLIGYEETHWTEDDFKDFPDEIKNLFRHLF